MIGVTGLKTTIVQELSKFDHVVRIDLYEKLPSIDLFVLAAGSLKSKTLAEQTEQEIEETFYVNLFNPTRLCESIFQKRKKARVCLVGSESGFKGSYDMAYAMSKAALHFYTETKAKQINTDQRLFAVAPHIIIDSGMTKRRHDYERLLVNHQKYNSYITAKEVAKVIWDGLNNGTTASIIRFHRT